MQKHMMAKPSPNATLRFKTHTETQPYVATGSLIEPILHNTRAQLLTSETASAT